MLHQIPDWLHEFMLVTSLFVLLAGISIAFKHQFGIGEGALERLAQYPESVWLILFGFYISRDHYRKKGDRGWLRVPWEASSAAEHPQVGPGKIRAGCKADSACVGAGFGKFRRGACGDRRESAGITG